MYISDTLSIGSVLGETQTVYPPYLPMDSLDDDSAVEIYRTLSSGGFRDLAPMLLVGKRQSALAFSPGVLQQLSLHEFFNNPDLVNEGSSFRKLFTKCVASSNPIAVYLEALRIACKEADLPKATTLLSTIVPFYEFACFAKRMFLIYLGSPTQGMEIISALYTRVGSIARLHAIANVVYRHLRILYPLQRWLFTSIHVVERIPLCLGQGCNSDNRCLHCFIFWFVIKLNEFM